MYGVQFSVGDVVESDTRVYIFGEFGGTVLISVFGQM